MSKRNKLIQKILDGKSDIKPNDAINILEFLEFVASQVGSSHLTFRKPNQPSVTIVLTQNPLKPYMVEKLQNTLKNEGY